MVTGEDAMGKEKERALKRLKAKMEFETLNGAYASGDSGVASGMVGIVGSISTLVTAHSSGQSFTEQILNDMAQDSYNQVGSEYIADILVAPIVIKRRVSGFGTNLTRNVQAKDKRLTKEVRVYDSEVGQTIMVLAHKDVNAAAGTLTALLLREDCFEHSFLVGTGEPHWEDRAVDGDRKNGVYITEMSLVSYAQRASVRRTGFNTGL
jgi:gas vesicle protein